MAGAEGPLAQGLALHAAGRFHEALQHFGLALRAQPLSLDARLALAQTCLALGDGFAATAWLSDACRVEPGRADLWLELGRQLQAQQRGAELDAALQAAALANPVQPQLLQALAERHLAAERYAPAASAYRQLDAVAPGDRVTLLHLGFCLEQSGDVDEAARCYRQALALEPDFMEAHVDLAGLLWRLEDHEGSLAHAKEAVRLAPNHPYAVRILGTALLHLNRLDEAQVQLRRALALSPGFPLAEVDLALTLLLAGRLGEGWPAYRLRWHDTQRMPRPSFFRLEAEWQGPQAQPVAGKRIAVYAEQGLGDVIHFIRYVRLLQREGATVCAIVQPELVPLVEGIAGVVCLTPGRHFEADWHVALLDLPLHYGTTLANIPADVPYLHAPAAARQRWRDRLQPWAGQRKIGLAWAGHPGQVNDRNRSMPLSTLMPLLALDGVQCFSLQKGDGGRYTDVAPDAARLIDWTAEWADFADSAAMVEALDLVVTVDTAVAHLAGALGKPVWLMLGPNPDWRWLLEREDSPWYPSVRLFRRGLHEPRQAQVARVLEALRAGGLKAVR